MTIKQAQEVVKNLVNISKYLRDQTNPYKIEIIDDAVNHTNLNAYAVHVIVPAVITAATFTDGTDVTGSLAGKTLPVGTYSLPLASLHLSGGQVIIYKL